MIARADQFEPVPRALTGRVLVLGDETRIVLPILRSLGRRGLEVHLAWCLPHEPVTRSRYLHQYHHLRRWEPDSESWLDDLRALLESTAFDLVIPATESAVFPLQRVRGKLDADWPIYLLNDRAFETCFDKGKTHELARSLGVPVPRQTLVRPGDELAGWSMPLALKPVCSVDSTNVDAKNFVRRVNNERDLEACFEQEDLWIVQEWFTGVGAGVEFLAHGGEILFAFQHERIHETIGYGSFYRKSVAMDPDLLAATRALVAATGYTGVGMAEYRIDPACHRFVLLEINARFWGSLPLAVVAGADFPAYLYDMLVQGRRDFPADYRRDVHSRDLINDVRWTWRALTRRDAAADVGWAMNHADRSKITVGVTRALTLRDHVDSFAKDDPMPALAEMWQLVTTAWSSAMSRLIKAHAPNPDAPPAPCPRPPGACP